MDLKVGDKFSTSKQITDSVVRAFADLSGDLLAPARREALLQALWDIDQAADIIQVIDLIRVEP